MVDRLVFGFNPYGMPDTGTPETMAGITRNDLVAFHQKYFVPNNAIFAIVGDVTAEEAFDTATKVFGRVAVARGGARAIRRAAELDAPRRSSSTSPIPCRPRSAWGSLGIPRNHPDYMALNLAIRILGGEGSNRLHQVLRTDRGLTYGAQADMVTRKESGEIVAETNTRSDATG